ncbi:hypothetical protein BGY98DRAFT_1093442 [Russula aff. rugulosa BPL654]|nr:hypothetical protein BGY98DRAFT_1093442 [Russula aff. rugulosa BPL654]
MAVSSSMTLIYVPSGPPGGRDAEEDLTCILRPETVMMKTGYLFSEALRARRNHLSDHEVESLKSGVEPDGDKTGIRPRRVGESQKRRNRPSGKYARTLGTNSTSSLISLDDLSTPDEIPTLGPKNRVPEPLKPPSLPASSVGTRAQSSTQALRQGDAAKSGSTAHSPDVQGSPNPQTPVLVGMPHVLEASQVPRPGNPFTSTLMALGEPENTRSSSPDTEFLSPSDILSGDQYLNLHDQSLTPQRFHGTSSPTLSSNLSAEFVSSAPLSPPGSPFVDAGMYFQMVESHRVGTAAPQSEIPGGAGQSSSDIAEGTPPGAVLRAVVRGDSEIFSLSSQLSSDMSSDEGDYDDASVLGSELSIGTSDGADGERAAA